MIENVKFYILLFFTYSFLGWLMESVGGIFKVKKFVNRGFLIGPYCPVYGTGVILITLLLDKYKNDVPALFLLSTVICGTLEYATSFFMEKWFNARWWDYHNRKFNINGRICLETLIPFGLAGTAIICLINPFFICLFHKIPETIVTGVVCGLVAVFLVDMIVSFCIISSFKHVTYESADNTEEISEKVREKTEDMLMKAESDAMIFSRKIKVRGLKFERKLKYTRKKAVSLLKESQSTFVQKVSKGIEADRMKMRNAKEVLELRQKQKLENFDNKLNDLRKSSEEFTKYVREKFQNHSLLKSRLMEAFPNLEVMIHKKKQKKNNEK